MTSPPVDTDSAAPSGGTPSLTEDSRRHASGSRHTSGAEQHVRTDKHTPRWRCFIRSLNGTQLFLTFVPATFDDLKILVQGDTTPNLPKDKDGAVDKETAKTTEQVVTLLRHFTSHVQCTVH